MIQGVIFDLDGVLVRTDELHFAAWKSVADLLGIPFSREDNTRLLGVGRRDCLDILLEKYSGTPLTEAEKESLCERKNILYRRQLSCLTPSDAAPGAVRTLEELRSRGMRLAVGSSSRNARLILEKTNLLPAFDAVADGTSGVRSKPEPDIFLHAAGLLGLAPSACLVVEDAPAGIPAARAAGMTAVFLGSAGRTADVQPDFVIASLADILPLTADLSHSESLP